MGKPRVAAAKVWRARMVLKADRDGPGWSDPQIGEAVCFRSVCVNFDVPWPTVILIKGT